MTVWCTQLLLLLVVVYINENTSSNAMVSACRVSLCLATIGIASGHVLTPRPNPSAFGCHRRSTAPNLLALRGGVFNPLQAYGNALATAPLATNVATATALSVLADTIAQKVTMTDGDDGQWDYSRSRWQLVWGSVVSGLLMSKWFAFLGRLFPDARTSMLELVKKLFVNQLFLSPGLNAGFFAFVVLTRTVPVGWMTPEKWSTLKTKISSDLLTVCLRSNMYWSVVQTLNFRVLPPSATVLSTNLFFVIWTVCVSRERTRLVENGAAFPPLPVPHDAQSRKLEPVGAGAGTSVLWATAHPQSLPRRPKCRDVAHL